MEIGTLSKGSTRTFPGTGTYDVVLGNAGAVRIDTGSGARRAGAAGRSAVLRYVVR